MEENETSKDIDNLMLLYSDSTIFIPEFHGTILSKNSIQEYYTQVLNKIDVISYERETKDIFAFEERIIEWGVFSKSIRQNRDSATKNIKGKYMNVWHIHNDKWKLISEQWNYDHEIDDSYDIKVYIANLPLRYKTYNTKHLDEALKFELDAYYALGAEAVKNRNPYGRLRSFRKDGVFLTPHGVEAKIGYQQLQDYLVDYNSGDVTIDSIDVGLNHIEDHGKYIIKYNYYYVEASGDGWTYKGQGQGTDFLIRNDKGQLRRMWQIGGEQAVPETPIPAEILKYDSISIASYKENDLSLLTSYYTDNFFLMAEYQPVLKGKTNVLKYHNEYLKRFHINRYRKNRIEGIAMENWFLETGEFTIDVRHKESGEKLALEGKYQNLWRQDTLGSWKIFAEAWNYNHPVDNWDLFVFPEVEVYDHFTNHDLEIPLHIKSLNNESENIIKSHDPYRWSELYDDEGMLLYSHAPIYRGKEEISNHLIKHVEELPHFNTLDIGTFFLAEIKGYYIELGNHETDWTMGSLQGNSHGKNIRIWKKHSNGSIKIFRQTAMYDLTEPIPSDTYNPFNKFFGTWRLKNDLWTQSKTLNNLDTILIPNHRTFCNSVNTSKSIFCQVESPTLSGHILWTYNNEDNSVDHLSHFGESRTGVGDGTIDEYGNLLLKVTFEWEGKGTYRLYKYEWLSDNEYKLSSTQYKDGVPTGDFYGGVFEKTKPRQK